MRAAAKRSAMKAAGSSTMATAHTETNRGS